LLQKPVHISTLVARVEKLLRQGESE